MGRYFVLQLKRTARFLPYGLCVAVILFACLGVVYQALMTAQEAEDEENAMKVTIGVVGTAEDKYLQWGMAAMQFDSTAMSIDLLQLEEDAAMEALRRGEIAAYVVFPENFIEEALYGNVQQLRFVSTAGAAGLVSIIKDEITVIVDDILVACESGAYGVGDALSDNGHGHLWGKHVNDLSLEYVDFLFDRSKMYQLIPLQQENYVPFERYMLGGLTVLLLMLVCLPFAPLYIRADQSLPRLLRSQRIMPVAQVLAEFTSYTLGLALLFGAVSLVIWLGGMLPENTTAWPLFLGALPAVLMVAALTYLFYSLSDHLISGVLLSFFGVLALCYVGGCMYPIHVFPVSLQRISVMLPSGIARESITSCLEGTGPTDVGVLFICSAVMLALAMAVRVHKVGKVRG